MDNRKVTPFVKEIQDTVKVAQNKLSDEDWLDFVKSMYDDFSDLLEMAKDNIEQEKNKVKV